MDEQTWDTVDRLVAWLDDSSTLPPDTDRLLRLMKLSEEVGEVTQAVIGVLGQNPRKGVTHTWPDVEAELCDVILTAMVALATVSPDARGVFAVQLGRVSARSATSSIDRIAAPLGLAAAEGQEQGEERAAEV